MMTLAQRQQQQPPPARPPQEGITVFVGSIAGGITDAFLNQLLSVLTARQACGPLTSFKRLITPANKPQGFGFATFETPEGALAAVKLLDGAELPGMEDGAVSKKLLVRPDELNKGRIDAYFASRMSTDQSDAAAHNGNLDKERYVVPPHLHDLQEADLPETQRGLVISEIALFRERAAKREREKMKEVPAPSSAPSGPKQREWGRPQGAPHSPPQQGYGRGAQGYSKPVGFVKEGGGESGSLASRIQKTDEELEDDRRDARRRDEENSFRDRERRYEPRERTRINALERSIARQRAVKEAEERDKVEMKSRLHIWDDDESDELFYTDRARWRSTRARRLAAEEAADEESRVYEEKEADNLRRESEAFLARQMDEMQALADEQRKAGMLLDDGAPVKLNVSLQAAAQKPEPTTETKAAAAAFAQDEEEEGFKKRKVPLVKLDFSVAEGGKAKERLEKIRENVPKDRETLFKAKVRWDGLTDQLIDRKLEPLIKRHMTKYLGELEDDDLVMFSVEHLKDHKGPQKLVEGLEPVLEEEAVELVVTIWRQVIFESMAYGEGLHTERMMVE
ncbi:hypothetical protein EW145_g4289 [Phellinidium pouzarii]|uniref:PWI domain-containing protein n=1 Tax=Phellinidium pouzarii TaxID=167371 RepID=A0A4S4L490_9AGAM|nr:hypothetical protein EW145_g4289 [Phellinidium pouzarii]